MSVNSEASLKRWNILRNYILNQRKMVSNPYDSLYSANIFGFFEIIQLKETPTAVTWRLIPQVAPGSCKYITLAIPKISTETENTVEELAGFDRTGVAKSVWPCELLLAYFFMLPLGRIQNVIQLPTQCNRALELAAGSLGIGGISLASAFPNLEYLALTDGNEKCVQSLKTVIKESNFSFNAKIESSVLRWSSEINEELPLTNEQDDWKNSFDLLFAADCFFNRFHGGLLRCIDLLLSNKPGSTFFALAPLRCGTLKSFVDLASSEDLCERFRWTVKLLRPEAVFPELSGDEEKMVPHMVCLQRK